MDLDDWLRLSPDEQTRRRQRWVGEPPLFAPGDREELEWQGLVHQAARRLSEEYREMPEVLHVGGACRFARGQSPSVLVVTRLPHGHRIALPGEYLTFPVEQEGVAESIAGFERTWEAALVRLFGWPPGAARDFVQGQEWVYRSPWFRHDPPSYFLPWIRLVGRVSDIDVCAVSKEFEEAAGLPFYVEDDPGYDWEAANQRVGAVAQKYYSGNQDQHSAGAETP
jgi:hypothetical protein